jgi:NTE family protein
MTETSLPPNVLVLGVGGILGEAWMSGFLAGSAHATGVDYRDVDAFMGTSAGSIVAAQLAAGAELQRPRNWTDAGDRSGPGDRSGGLRAATERAGRLYLSAISPLAAPALSAATRAGALARAALLASLPRGTTPLDDLHARVTALNSRFDGRLRVVAVERGSGRRVVFGAPGAPPSAVADAVVASCAIPGVLRPARIGGREYVDGGVWSPTNLDAAAIGRGDRVLCLVPTAVLGGISTFPLRTLAAGWRLTTAIEAEAARRRGATVTVIAPDAGARAAMGTNLMDARPRERVLAEGFRQGRADAGSRSTAGAGSA